MIEYKGKTYLTTSDISDRSGLSVRKVYEIQKILPTEGTTPGNYRLYGERAVARAIQVKWFMNMGMKIPEIKKLYDDKKLDSDEAAVVDSLLRKLKQERNEIDNYIRILENARKMGLRNAISFIDNVPQTDIRLWTDALNNLIRHVIKLLKEEPGASLMTALNQTSVTRKEMGDYYMVTLRGAVDVESAVRSYYEKLQSDTGINAAVAAMGMSVSIGAVGDDEAWGHGYILWDYAMDILEPKLREGLEQCRADKEDVVFRWTQLLMDQTRKLTAVLGFQSMRPMLSLLYVGDDVTEEDLAEDISRLIKRCVTPVDDAVEMLGAIHMELYDELVEWLRTKQSYQ